MCKKGGKQQKNNIFPVFYSFSVGGEIMKKIIILFLCISLISFSFIGCAQSPLNPKSPVTLNMWHNYGGDMQASMDILIDQFNSTIGKEQGIVINVTAISSSSELNKSLDMIVNGDPGAPDMPDIFTGYPKTAIQFQEEEMLANLDKYFTENELENYVNAFVEEGRLSDGGLYVFPIAKSTEVLYLNQTLFDRFAEATGADINDLYTFEGIARLSKQYYEWSGGKSFYAADSWFNFAEVGMVQLGDSLFKNETLDLSSSNYEHIFSTIFTPAVEGGIAIYDGYSSDLSKTGDLVCSTGSSAGILFYGDTITYTDGTVENVEYNILPYPIFENGSKTALQRGGGLMVAKTDEKREYAACEFIKWLTAPEQNMKFIEKTGYLPVTKQAFETDMRTLLDTLEDLRIKKMLTAVLTMYDEYSFFTAPNYINFDDDSSSYEETFKELLAIEQQKFAKGENTNYQDILTKMRK